jgi:hypothetical protein
MRAFPSAELIDDPGETVREADRYEAKGKATQVEGNVKRADQLSHV